MILILEGCFAPVAIGEAKKVEDEEKFKIEMKLNWGIVLR